MEQFTQEYLQSAIQRIKTKVIIDNKDCWVWQGGRFPDGYPGIWFNQKTWRGNRLMCALFHGDKKNLSALHSCDNPLCVNPQHLRWGTPKENSLDMVARNRSSRGAKNGSAILTNEQVDTVRQMLLDNHKIIDIANLFGVNRHAIQNIKYGKSWKN